MTSHEEKGTPAVSWLTAEVSRLFYSDTPVTAVLDIAIKIDLRSDTIPIADAQVIRNRQRSWILLKFHEMLGAKQGFKPRVVELDGNQIAIPFRAKNDQSKYLCSTAGHNDSVKAAYMTRIGDSIKARVNQLTAQANQQDDLRWDLVNSASITVTLVRPLDYAPLIFTTNMQGELTSLRGNPGE